jgi:hypothetical protein
MCGAAVASWIGALVFWLQFRTAMHRAHIASVARCGDQPRTNAVPKSKAPADFPGDLTAIFPWNSSELAPHLVPADH